MNPSEDNSRRPDQLIRLEPNQKQQDHTFKLDKTKQLEQAIEANSRETGDKRNTITSIQAQKRPGRYNIYLGEEYAFPVDEELIIKYMLHKGMVLSPAFQEELKVEDVSRKAYQRALNYLSYGLRSEKEVRDDLKEKEFEEQADEVIERLKEQRLIDDLEYAKSFVRTSANLNRKGPSVIQNELFRRGIDKLSIEEAPL